MVSTTPAREAAAEVEPTRIRAGRFYHPELDTLRFFAFFVVFLHHALPHEVSGYAGYGLSSLAQLALAAGSTAGRFGVDLFFVLSSYLITELLLREYEQRGRLDVRAFYVRRALRIWPLYYFFILLTLVVVPLLLPADRFSMPHPVWFSLLAGNWSVAFWHYPLSVAAPLWSVSIEEQFYLVWPLVVAWLGAGRLQRAALVMIGIAVVTRLVLAALGAPDRVYWAITPARLDPIAIGALLALLLRGRVPVLSASLRLVMLLSGPAVWLLVVKFNPGGWFNSIVYLAVALSGAAMVASVLRERAGPVSGAPLLVYLGRISYGLYVYHVLGIQLARRILGEPATGPMLAGEFALGLILTTVFASASYRWLEMPFLRLKVRFTHVPSRL